MFPGDARFAFIYDGEIKENEGGEAEERGRQGKRERGTGSSAVRGSEGVCKRNASRHAVSPVHRYALTHGKV